MAKDGDSPDETDVTDETLPNLAEIQDWAAAVSKDTGAPDTELPGDDEDDPPEEGKAADKTALETPAAPAKGDKPVLLAKDGKHAIPYSRLEESNAARDAAVQRAAELEAQLKEQQTRLEAIEAATKAAEQAESKGEAAPPAATSTDEIEQAIAALEEGVKEMREEGSEWMAGQQEIQIKTMRALLTRQQAIERQEAERQQQAEAREKEQKEQEKQSVEQQVQAAIDAVPALKHWQENKPAFFSEAGDIDTKLRADPAWAHKPFKERFEKVVELMTKEYGQTILPTGSAAPPKKGKDGLPPPITDAGVNTLTDIQGGTPTSQSALEAAETASTDDLSREYEKMSPDEILRSVMRG